MSSTRCGLEITRGNVISREPHDWPREKQMKCLIGYPQVDRSVPVVSNAVASEEIENQLQEAVAEGAQPMPGMQKGEGVFDFLKRIPKNIKRGAEIGAAKVSNLFPSSDENAADIYPGENHAIVRLPNKKYGRANYTGPGTQIVKRLRRGDKPRVLSDKVSKAHDIRYGLAQNTSDVRKADQTMLRKLRQLEREGTDELANILPAKVGIRGKVLAEDFSLLSRDAFVDYKPLSSGDRALMEQNLSKLEQEGYGYASIGVSSTKPRPPTLDRRAANWSLLQRAAYPSKQDVKAAYQNRSFSTQANQTGGMQEPGEPSSASSEQVAIGTAFRAPGKFKDVRKVMHGAQHGGQGSWPGVGLIDVKGSGVGPVGVGRRGPKQPPVKRGNPYDKARRSAKQYGGILPGERLLRSMLKGRKAGHPPRRRKQHSAQSAREMAGFLATQMMPLVRVQA